VASDALYLAAATDVARQAELAQGRDLVPNAAYCSARLGHREAAVVQLEVGRTRALAEVLARDRAALDRATPADRAAFVAARERIDALEGEARATGADAALAAGGAPGRPFTAISDDLRSARQGLAEVAARIRTYISDFLPTAPDFAAIAAATGAEPLVYLLTTSQGSLALLVPPGTTGLDDKHAVWLDAFRNEDLERLLLEQDEQGKVTGGYLVGQVTGDLAMLTAALDRILPTLHERLIKSVAARLRELGFDRAVLIPSGRLSLLPLHAAAFDALTVTYAPSARALHAARAAAGERAGRTPTLMAIGNPLPSRQPLAFARSEVDALTPLFPSAGQRVLTEHEATREATLQQVPGATYLHFSCHGSFNVDEPLDSALSLAGNDTVTLRDLLDGDLDLSAARLAVLSACQTGLTDFRKVPDEAVGLPAGFLQAGVPTVLGTLWSVEDLSTALLMERFYRYHLRDGIDPASALHQAQQDVRTKSARELDRAHRYEALYRASDGRDADALKSLRWYRANPDATPFAHPYYWAPFVLAGASGS